LADLVTVTEVNPTPDACHEDIILHLLNSLVLLRNIRHGCENDREGHRAGSVDRLKDGAGCCIGRAVRAGIFRMRRRIDQWLPAGVAIGCRVAVLITVTDCGDRPLEVVVVLGIKHRQVTVEHGDIQ
jgi:hypothetical protein